MRLGAAIVELTPPKLVCACGSPTWFRPFATALGVLRYGQMMSEGILDRDAVDQLDALAPSSRCCDWQLLVHVTQNEIDGAEIGKRFALDDTTRQNGFLLRSRSR